MTKECAEIVKEQTCCVYLRASVETLVGHLEGQANDRPLLNSPNCHSEKVSCRFGRTEQDEKSNLRDRITTLMAQRSATYEKTARIVVDTDGKSIEAIALEIKNLLK